MLSRRVKRHPTCRSSDSQPFPYSLPLSAWHNLGTPIASSSLPVPSPWEERAASAPPRAGARRTPRLETHIDSLCPAFLVCKTGPTCQFTDRIIVKTDSNYISKGLVSSTLLCKYWMHLNASSDVNLPPDLCPPVMCHGPKW